MSAIDQLYSEMARVRGEVLDRQVKAKFTIYLGRFAEMEIKRDPLIFSTGMYAYSKGPAAQNKFMDALMMLDLGMPAYAVRIDVDGKPYTTFSLEPPTA